MTLLFWLRIGALTLAVATLSHWVALSYAPQIMMLGFMRAMSSDGRTNTITHYERATAAFRKFPAPSPDLLYSACVYDVSEQPLKVTTAAPTDTYWSVALYAANSDNFFVMNDRVAREKPTTIVIVGAQSSAITLDGASVVKSPSATGVVIFRTLINDDARESELDQERRKANCQPL